ncbi:hypothetical protein GWK47_025080 [Chionoecetes opilio]|uniref:Uncharacterized protein n=1 Tax=Chionoecetes opilio TaxID=41210 RepID=A0A8J4XKL5_CHIOP|nr:hypothetical protein GWK47_025080 [Chionoecetes opilio]
MARLGDSDMLPGMTKQPTTLEPLTPGLRTRILNPGMWAGIAQALPETRHPGSTWWGRRTAAGRTTIRNRRHLRHSRAFRGHDDGTAATAWRQPAKPRKASTHRRAPRTC